MSVVFSDLFLIDGKLMKPISNTDFYCCGVRMQDAEKSNLVRRCFCPICESQVFGKPEILPNVLGIRAGSLDNPGLYQPMMDIYTSSARHWDFMNPDLPKFSHLPPRK